MSLARAPGFTLIEMMVALAVLSLLMMMGVPAFGDWMRNTQIRSTAESLRSGLQMARAEAVRRNDRVRLQFTTSLGNDCQLATAGPYWVINQKASQSPASACGQGTNTNAAPYLLQTSAVVSSRGGVTLSATRSVVAFDALGRQADTTNPSSLVSTLTVDITSASGSCVSDGGTVRCLRVVVSPAGDARLCDPARSTSNTALTDPLHC